MTRIQSQGPETVTMVTACITLRTALANKYCINKWFSCGRKTARRFILRDLEMIHNESVSRFYRQDAAKRQTAGIKFTYRPKIRFFSPQRRLVAPIHVKLGVADGHLGPLGCAKYHLNRRRGWECGPQKYQKFPLFGKESPRRSEPLDQFLKFLRTFIRLTILH